MCKLLYALICMNALLLIASVKAKALLNLDLSNVDPNFKYFRYARTTSPPIIYLHSANLYLRRVPHRDSKLVTTFKKARAVYDYFKQVLVGDPLANQRINFHFDPNFAIRNSKKFQDHYGQFGERLIDLLGKGKSKEELVYYGAVSENTVHV